MASMTNYKKAKAQMEEHLQFVAREIGCDWKKLARELKIDRPVIEGIEVQHTTEDERAYQVLVKWSQDKGFSGATKDILIKALKDIGKTSIAEGIENKNGNASHHNPPQQLMIDAIPHDEPHTSTEERRKPPSPTCNHIIEKFGKTVKEMYQTCRDNLTTSTDCPTLVNKLKQAQHVKDLSEIFAHLIESNGYISCNRMELLQKSCETLLQQTDETMNFILQTLTCRGQPNPNKASQRKGRPASTGGIIVPQLSSEVELQPRSNTFSNGTASLYKCNQIHEEELPDTEEATESFPRRHCCGSCLNFEAERCASENQKISLEENCSEPLQQTSSIKSEEPNKSSVTRSSSSPFPTPNSFKFEELTKELGKMLKYCQDSLPSCHRLELGHILKFLEYIQALNEMMLDATDSRTPKKDDEPEIAEMKKAHRARHRETDQTILLTEHVLTDRMHKSRPVSQILRRCTSTIILPQSRQMCEILPRCTRIIIPMKASQRIGRPVSEILPQRSSEVELQRSNTFIATEYRLYPNAIKSMRRRYQTLKRQQKAFLAATAAVAV